jgi:hypothetical protein
VVVSDVQDIDAYLDHDVDPDPGHYIIPREQPRGGNVAFLPPENRYPVTEGHLNIIDMDLDNSKVDVDAQML